MFALQWRISVVEYAFLVTLCAMNAIALKTKCVGKSMPENGIGWE